MQEEIENPLFPYGKSTETKYFTSSSFFPLFSLLLKYKETAVSVQLLYQYLLWEYYFLGFILNILPRLIFLEWIKRSDSYYLNLNLNDLIS